MGRAVHLTFDDGPDELWTARILKELDRLDARATFFVVGERVAANPALVARMRDAGHQVEAHCMRHVLHLNCWRATAEADIDACLRELAKLGIEAGHWRPPGGGLAVWTADVAAARGLRLAGWSADPADWRGDGVGTMIERVSPEIEDGAVIVMHDALGPGARRGDCASTVELIEPLVALSRERGFEPNVLGRGSSLQGRGFTRFSPRSTDRSPYRPRPPRADLRFEVIPETELMDADRAGIVSLIAAEFGPLGAEYAGRGWRTLEPESRVVGRVGEAIVAHGAVVRLESDPPMPIYGLADAVVATAYRGGGIGGAVTAGVVEESWRLGAEMILVASVDMERALVSYGFEPVPRFACYYERDAACRWHPNWLAAFRARPPATRLRLAEGDF